MRSFWKSLFAFCTLGLGTVACKTESPPPGPPATTDVTLVVPGMH